MRKLPFFLYLALVAYVGYRLLAYKLVFDGFSTATFVTMLVLAATALPWSALQFLWWDPKAPGGTGAGMGYVLAFEWAGIATNLALLAWFGWRKRPSGSSSAAESSRTAAPPGQ